MAWQWLRSVVVYTVACLIAAMLWGVAFPVLVLMGCEAAGLPHAYAACVVGWVLSIGVGWTGAAGFMRDMGWAGRAKGEE